MNVEDEVLVVGFEGEAAAEVDAPVQHHGGGHHGQRVRHVRERRRPHAQPHRLRPSALLPLSPAPLSLAGSAAGFPDGRSEWRQCGSVASPRLL